MTSDRHKAYQRAWNARRRWENRQKVEAIKLESGCVDCGYAGHPAALDFDHLDPETKSFEVSQCLGYSWERLEVEIAKCVVRCANCHRIETWRARWEGHVPDLDYESVPNRGGTDLTDEQVVDIRVRAAGGEGLDYLAEEFGLSKQSVIDLVWGRTFQDLGGPIRERRTRGVEKRSARLNPAAVRDIRHRHSRGELQKALAVEYGVSHTTVKRVVDRVTWKHVD